MFHMPLVPKDKALPNLMGGHGPIRNRPSRARPKPLGDAYYDYSNVATPAPSATATGVWRYMMGVSLFLVVWVMSLLFPKGFRKQFFGASPKRYSRRRYELHELGGDGSTNFSTLESVDDSMLMEVEKRRMVNDLSVESSSAFLTNFGSSIQEPPHTKTTTPQKQSQNHTLSTISDSETGSLYLRPTVRRGRRTRGASTPSPSFGFRGASPGMAPPSPVHPGIQRLPSPKILNETMQRLKSRGVRLVAHGVASESKRVWIKLEDDDDTTSLSWQTEFARKVPNQLGEISIVMMRGALHRIALPNILYVDVGKKTNALQKPDNRDIPDSVCFSLLTQNGSLDLQANSRLERDALVSSFSMVLDEVHTQDWRSLYADSPETSAVMSTCTGSDLNQVEF